jgi:hypothetical protein
MLLLFPCLMTQHLYPTLPGHWCYWEANKGRNSLNGPWSRRNQMADSP